MVSLLQKVFISDKQGTGLTFWVLLSSPTYITSVAIWSSNFFTDVSVGLPTDSNKYIKLNDTISELQ
jgi:hypothetical protein